MKVSNNTPTNPQLVEQARQSEKKDATTSTERSGNSTSTGHSGSAVSVSDDAKLMNQALNIAKASPDVRHDKIAALKAQIKEGTYRIDAESIADRILTEHLNTDFGKNAL